MNKYYDELHKLNIKKAKEILSYNRKIKERNGTYELVSVSRYGTTYSVAELEAISGVDIFASITVDGDECDIKIDYTAYDFVKEPTRLALIDAKMYGIPFQGIDISMDGKGTMKGVIAKNIQLFNESFDIIDATYLSEALMHPSLALQESISYRELDDYRVEATIRKNGSETTGVFYFNGDYEMTSFVVEKRLCSDTNTYEKWSAITGDYEIVDGINIPTKFQAVWNFTSGDLVYFNGDNMKISYK